jgi:hypothetical protein
MRILRFTVRSVLSFSRMRRFVLDAYVVAPDALFDGTVPSRAVAIRSDSAEIQACARNCLPIGWTQWRSCGRRSGAHVESRTKHLVRRERLRRRDVRFVRASPLLGEDAVRRRRPGRVCAGRVRLPAVCVGRHGLRRCGRARDADVHSRDGSSQGGVRGRSSSAVQRARPRLALTHPERRPP